MTSSDDSLREIQLNGKQLVFLFMAVTVVSVVIFLCGVLVGRGVQARSAAAAEAAAATPDPANDPTADAAPPAAADTATPTKAEGLAYPESLEADAPVAEKLAKPGAAASAAAKPDPSASSKTPAPATPAKPAAGEAPAGKASAPAPSAPAATTAKAAPPKPEAAEKPLPPEPKGDGMAIQVAALRGRTEAEAVVARLKGKGYTAYIVPSAAGQPAQFRVRVGKYKTRAEAEKVAAKLAQEEQFNPWITR